MTLHLPPELTWWDLSRFDGGMAFPYAEHQMYFEQGLPRFDGVRRFVGPVSTRDAVAPTLRGWSVSHDERPQVPGPGILLAAVGDMSDTSEAA